MKIDCLFTMKKHNKIVIDIATKLQHLEIFFYSSALSASHIKSTQLI